MPREKESYRDNVERIRAFLQSKYNDNREFLSIADVKEFLGRSYDFVHRHFDIDRSGVSVASFANMLS